MGPGRPCPGSSTPITKRGTEESMGQGASPPRETWPHPRLVPKPPEFLAQMSPNLLPAPKSDPLDIPEPGEAQGPPLWVEHPGREEWSSGREERRCERGRRGRGQPREGGEELWDGEERPRAAGAGRSFLQGLLLAQSLKESEFQIRT